MPGFEPREDEVLRWRAWRKQDGTEETPNIAGQSMEKQYILYLKRLDELEARGQVIRHTKEEQTLIFFEKETVKYKGFMRPTWQAYRKMDNLISRVRKLTTSARADTPYQIKRVVDKSRPPAYVAMNISKPEHFKDKQQIIQVANVTGGENRIKQLEILKRTPLKSRQHNIDQTIDQWLEATGIRNKKQRKRQRSV